MNASDRDTVRAVYREMLRDGSGWIRDWHSRLPAIDEGAIRAAVALLERTGVVAPDGGIRKLTGAPVDFEEQAQLKEHTRHCLTRDEDGVAWRVLVGCTQRDPSAGERAVRRAGMTRRV